MPMDTLTMWAQGNTEPTVISADEVSVVCPYSPAIGDLPSLNLGCGIYPMGGWINADIADGEGVDVVFDCEMEWPFPDNHFKIIYSSHVVEHLEDPVYVFREANRCLHPDGCMLVRVPHPRHSLNMGEPDHKRVVPEHFFWWLHMDARGTHNLELSDKVPLFHARVIAQVYEPSRSPIKKWMPKKMKRLMAEHLWNVCEELMVWLAPIKEEV